MTSVVGQAIRLTEAPAENFRSITQLWQRLNRELHRIQNRPRPSKDWQKFGITYPTEGGSGYLAAIPLLPQMRIPEHMARTIIPAGQYACFTHIGPMTRLHTTIQALYDTHLPALDMERATPENAGLFHFEHYDARFYWNRANSCIDIFVPLKSGKESQS